MNTKASVAAAMRLAVASAVAAFLTVFLTAGCSAPEVSFAGFSDEQLKGLFPGNSEINAVVGQRVTLREPEPIDFTQTATPAQNPGLFKDCYEAYFGTPESNIASASRGFTMAGWTEGSPLYPYVWHLVQRRSAEEARQVIEDTITRLGKCRRRHDLFQRLRAAAVRGTGDCPGNGGCDGKAAGGGDGTLMRHVESNQYLASGRYTLDDSGEKRRRYSYGADNSRRALRIAWSLAAWLRRRLGLEHQLPAGNVQQDPTAFHFELGGLSV